MSQTDQWVNHPETLCNISKQNTPYCNYRVIKIIMGSLVLSPQYTNMLKQLQTERKRLVSLLSLTGFFFKLFNIFSVLSEKKHQLTQIQLYILLNRTILLKKISLNKKHLIICNNAIKSWFVCFTFIELDSRSSGPC